MVDKLPEMRHQAEIRHLVSRGDDCGRRAPSSARVGLGIRALHYGGDGGGGTSKLEVLSVSGGKAN